MVTGWSRPTDRKTSGEHCLGLFVRPESPIADRKRRENRRHLGMIRPVQRLHDRDRQLVECDRVGKRAGRMPGVRQPDHHIGHAGVILAKLPLPQGHE